MRGPGLPGERERGCRVTRVGENGPEPLPRAPDSVLKPLRPAMAPRPPPRLPGSRPWARPALGTAGVTRAGGPGGGVEGTGGPCGISARLAELGGCAGRGAPGGVELCVYLPSVLVLRGALASPPQQPGPTSPWEWGGLNRGAVDTTSTSLCLGESLSSGSCSKNSMASFKSLVPPEQPSRCWCSQQVSLSPWKSSCGHGSFKRSVYSYCNLCPTQLLGDGQLWVFTLLPSTIAE